jgi:signal transduction histidine kinase/CheY-like chemotaxis protein
MRSEEEPRTRRGAWLKGVRILVSVLGFCCCLAVSAFTWMSLDGDERLARAVSDQHLVTYSANVLAAQIQEALGRMDRVAGSFVAADVTARDRSQAAAKVIRAMGLLSGVSKVSVFDASGQLLASSQIAAGPETLSRGVLRELLASPSDRLSLHVLPAAPGSDGAMIGARRIEDGRDQLVGLVAVTIKPGALQAMLMADWLPQNVRAEILPSSAPAAKEPQPGTGSNDRNVDATELFRRWLRLEQPRQRPIVAIASLPGQDLRIRTRLDPAGQLDGERSAAEHLSWIAIAVLSSGALAFLSGAVRPIDQRAHDRRVAELEADLRSAAAAVSTSQRAVHDARRDRDLALASVGHDVRTLLTSISGFAMLLRESDLEEQQRAWTETLLASAQNLLDMVNGLLEMASGNSGQRELQMAEVDVLSLMRETSTVLERQAREKDLDLRVHISPELGGIWRLDPTRLRQVLLNLVVNAIKYTSRGEVTISACVLPQEAEAMEAAVHRMVQIRVADTGPGIPEADRARIFGEFQRGSLHEGEGGGLGLGLAICKSNAELMRGTLDFDTEVAVGTEFRFEFLAERLRDAPRVIPFAGMVSLVVGFTDGLRRRLSRHLEDSGFAVETAADGFIGHGVAERAVAVHEKVDLVIVDGNMSHLRAADFVDRLRKLPVHELTRVVWVGTSGDGEAGAAKQRADAFIAPPGEISEIVAAVGEVMEGVPVHEMPESPADGHDRARILVVEDDKAIQSMFVTFLSGQGYSVFTVSNGEDAVRAASRGKIDAILMDIQLPGVDGYEATRRIRALGGPLAVIPILGQTALTGAVIQKRCKDVGMTGLVEKPPNLHEVCATLRTVIADARRSALYKELSTSPEAETDPAPRLAVDGSREVISAMIESFGASHAQSFVEDRAIKLRLKAHDLVDLVLPWEVAILQRVCGEITELARDVGALPLVILLAKMLQTVNAGDRVKAETMALEIEEHANRLGPALMSYLDEMNPKLDPLRS